MHLNNVLLPDPLGPKITFTSPSFISKDIPFRTSRSPKDFQISDTSKTTELLKIHPPPKPNRFNFFVMYSPTNFVTG